MTPDSVGPLSRPLPLHAIKPDGTRVHVETTAAEREALARDLDLPAIHTLEARFRVVALGDRIRVTGRVESRLDQVCVVSLEPFESRVDEEVEAEFQLPGRARAGSRGEELELTPDDLAAEELVGDRVDLGAIAAEFLALGLDPYPRKPGAVFENPPEDTEEGPFGRLAVLRPESGGTG
ncbi:DUF177 domain-containing protein [Enterovirga sp.]|uniref:YceD family protein n=1 Tax=Enterovirga sp. TaxID=2026350 RepID=UPI00261F1992|nr:DUF177 domain-containing protein [Enterovirga sp.]MDB5592409.1 hypothetical protein [Enterovirga sp.]